MKRSRAILLVCFVFGLAACSSPIAGERLSPAFDLTQSKANGRNLYVANSHAVSIYALPKGTLLRSISNKNPRAMAFDRTGNLYVADDAANTVTVYAHGTDSILRVITDGLSAPNSLAFDASGNLYVSNNKNQSVTVYAPGSRLVLRTITDGVNGPHDVIFNKRGYLFVGNNGSNRITVYPPGGQNVIRTIVTHNGPVALAFNGAQDLFCVNNFNVTVYRPGETEPYRTITDGISLPSALAFDSSGDLYVANWGSNMFRSTIAIYAPGSSSPRREISNGISYPLSLVFDASDDLYVANSAANSVTEYAKGSPKVIRTITNHISAPAALALGP